MRLLNSRLAHGCHNRKRGHRHTALTDGASCFAAETGGGVAMRDAPLSVSPAATPPTRSHRKPRGTASECSAPETWARGHDTHVPLAAFPHHPRGSCLGAFQYFYTAPVPNRPPAVLCPNPNRSKRKTNTDAGASRGEARSGIRNYGLGIRDYGLGIRD